MAGRCIRVALQWLGLLLLLLKGQTACARPNWNAIVHATWIPDTRTVEVLVQPVTHGAAYLKVCLHPPMSTFCEGNVHPSESPSGIFRYKVTDLAVNTNYTVLVKPFDDKKVEMDIWVECRHKVFTQVLNPADVGDEVEPVREDIEIWVVILVVVVIVAAAFGVLFCLWRRDRLRRNWFLGCCCFTHVVRNHPRIEILRLYAAETSELVQVVEQHTSLLKQHLFLNVRDWRQQNLRCLEPHVRVIVYVSPTLIRELANLTSEGLSRDRNQLDPLASACAQLILHRKKGHKPVVVMTGCYQNGEEHDQFLNSQPVLRGLTRFWISKGTNLEQPHDLLGKLSGFHHSFFQSSFNWNYDSRADALRRAVKDLRHQAAGWIPPEEEEEDIEDSDSVSVEMRMLNERSGWSS